MARRRFRRQAERASVVGAGSFGTGVALLLERAGVRTTLLCRTPEQAERLVRTFGRERIACVAGPAHAREMVEGGAGLVCASHDPELAARVAELFRRGRVVCETSTDPVGVELAGCAKNAAALAAGATESQGMDAAGMGAAAVFAGE